MSREANATLKRGPASAANRKLVAVLWLSDVSIVFEDLSLVEVYLTEAAGTILPNDKALVLTPRSPKEAQMCCSQETGNCTEVNSTHKRVSFDEGNETSMTSKKERR